MFTDENMTSREGGADTRTYGTNEGLGEVFIEDSSAISLICFKSKDFKLITFKSPVDSSDDYELTDFAIEIYKDMSSKKVSI